MHCFSSTHWHVSSHSDSYLLPADGLSDVARLLLQILLNHLYIVFSRLFVCLQTCLGHTKAKVVKENAVLDYFLQQSTLNFVQEVWSLTGCEVVRISPFPCPTCWRRPGQPFPVPFAEILPLKVTLHWSAILAAQEEDKSRQTDSARIAEQGRTLAKLLQQVRVAWLAGVPRAPRVSPCHARRSATSRTRTRPSSNSWSARRAPLWAAA